SVRLSRYSISTASGRGQSETRSLSCVNDVSPRNSRAKAGGACMPHGLTLPSRLPRKGTLLALKNCSTACDLNLARRICADSSGITLTKFRTAKSSLLGEAAVSSARSLILRTDGLLLLQGTIP